MKKKIIVVLVILVSFILSGVCLSFLEFRSNKDKTTETIQEEKILVEDRSGGEILQDIMPIWRANILLN